MGLFVLRGLMRFNKWSYFTLYMQHKEVKMMKNKRFSLFLMLIIALGISLLIPSMLGSYGIEDLPWDKRRYGEAAIRAARSSLDNPIRRLLARRLKVMSVDINNKTGEINSLVSVKSFFGIHYCCVELYGKINHQDTINMGFDHILIK